MTKSDNIIWDENICPSGEIRIKHCWRWRDMKTNQIKSCHWQYWDEEGKYCEVNWSKDLE